MEFNQFVFCPHLKLNNVNVLNYQAHALTVSQTDNASCPSLYNLCGVCILLHLESLNVPFSNHIMVAMGNEWQYVCKRLKQRCL